tara:strand:- start:61 stop:351 length:291 start_codon:yes stop_codon:yes gene_type:complete
MKIAIAGLGYVGLSNAVLLAQHNEVVAIDIVSEKVIMLNHKVATIQDVEMKDYLNAASRNTALIIKRYPLFMVREVMRQLIDNLCIISAVHPRTLL